ncbi:MAG: hypothetical protein LBT90_02615 [Holosporaceae bacterium]|nr:hypothetical protein [Holosporaceae bacterium]
MYIIFGEKNVRVFDKNECNEIFEIEFFLTHRLNFDLKEYKIIIDSNIIDFQLEKLSNCNWIDALKVLRCQKKLLLPQEWIFLIPPSKQIFWKKSNRYIQKNILQSPNFLRDHGLDDENGCFLMEYIIGYLCHGLIGIGDESWWLYVADHCSSGIKIVAGIGNGIIFSRILSSSVIGYIEEEILRTIRFLKRFGFTSDMKILTTLDNVFLDSHDFTLIKTTPEKIAEKFSLKSCHDDMEQLMMEFLTHNFRKIRTVFGTETYVDKFLKHNIAKIYSMVAVALVLMVSWFVHLQSKISEETKTIHGLSKKFVIADDLSESLKLKIDSTSDATIAQLIDFSKKQINILEALRQISIFLGKNEITVQDFHLMENIFQFRARLSPQMANILQQQFGNKCQIILPKEKNTDGLEYEEILSPKSSTSTGTGSIVCVQLK